MYDEVRQLQSWLEEHELKITKLKTDTRMVQVEVRSASGAWQLWVDDEYNDFDETNQAMCLFLVLNSLADYKESTDYLNWCQQIGINAGDSPWLAYYQSLESAYREIENLLGAIDPCITPLNYQLRSGAFHALASLK
ncbi:MAG: hypothetical protein R2820_04185 [Cyclobacteriaceae bacterium]